MTTLRILLLLTLPFCLLGQVNSDWAFPFGDSNQEFIHDLCTSQNGNIIAVGFTKSNTKGGKDGYFLEVDPVSGNRLNALPIGYSKDEEIKSISTTWDGGYLLAGFSDSFKGSREGWLAKVDENGKMLWDESFGTGGKDEFYYTSVLQNGTAFVVGEKNNGKNGDLWILNIHKNEILWDTLIGKNEFEELGGVNKTGGDVFILAGTSIKGRHAWVMKFDMKTKKIVRTRIHDLDKNYVQVHDVIPTLENGYALTGNIRPNGIGDMDRWYLLLNENGDIIKNINIGGVRDDYAKSLIQSSEGAYYISGSTKSHQMNARKPAFTVSMISQEGKLLKENLLDDQDQIIEGEGGSSIINFDGTMVFARSNEIKEEDIWLHKYHFSSSDKDLADVELSYSEIRFEDYIEGNGNGILEPGERGNIAFELKNNSPYLIKNVKIIADQKKKVDGLKYSNWRKSHTGVFLPNAKQKFSVPIIGLPELRSGESLFEISLLVGGDKKATFKYKIICNSNNEDAGRISSTIRWVSPDPIDEDTLFLDIDNTHLDIKAEILGPGKASKTKLISTINGISLSDSKEDSGSLDFETYGTAIRSVYKKSFSLENTLFKEGYNTIILEYETEKGDTIKSKPIYINVSRQRSNLHVLAIGAPHEDLQFTSNDARDFARSFENQKGDQTLFNEVFITQLTTKETTTRDGIEEAVYQLKEDFENGKIKRYDVLILFISSHGKNLLEDGAYKFHLIPSDYNRKEYRLIDFEEYVLKSLNKINCKKILFIDACHSGSIGGAKDDPTDTALSEALHQLKKQAKGMFTLTSCRYDELSYENKAWENGAFTEAILEAFSNKPFLSPDGQKLFPDKNENDILTLNELYEFLQNRVPEMVNKVNGRSQMPDMYFENINKDIPVSIYIIK